MCMLKSPIMIYGSVHFSLKYCQFFTYHQGHVIIHTHLELFYVPGDFKLSLLQNNHFIFYNIFVLNFTISDIIQLSFLWYLPRIFFFLTFISNIYIFFHFGYFWEFFLFASISWNFIMMCLSISFYSSHLEFSGLHES